MKGKQIIIMMFLVIGLAGMSYWWFFLMVSGEMLDRQPAARLLSQILVVSTSLGFVYSAITGLLLKRVEAEKNLSRCLINIFDIAVAVIVAVIWRYMTDDQSLRTIMAVVSVFYLMFAVGRVVDFIVAGYSKRQQETG